MSLAFSRRAAHVVWKLLNTKGVALKRSEVLQLPVGSRVLVEMYAGNDGRPLDRRYLLAEGTIQGWQHEGELRPLVHIRAIRVRGSLCRIQSRRSYAMELPDGNQNIAYYLL